MRCHVIAVNISTSYSQTTFPRESTSSVVAGNLTGVPANQPVTVVSTSVNSLPVLTLTDRSQQTPIIVRMDYITIFHLWSDCTLSVVRRKKVTTENNKIAIGSECSIKWGNDVHRAVILGIACELNHTYFCFNTTQL